MHVYVPVCLYHILQIQIAVVYILLLPQVCNGSHCAMHCVDENDDLPKRLDSKSLK